MVPGICGYLVHIKPQLTQLKLSISELVLSVIYLTS